MNKKKSAVQLKENLKNVVKTLFSFSVVGAVIYSAFLLQEMDFPEVLPVENIEVVGELKYLDKAEIVTMLKQDVSGGYFTVDLTGLREMLILQPWIKDVSLRRKWPAGISVYIEEKVPVAYWNEDSFISESGDVFKPAKRVTAPMLPMLNGPVGHHGDVWKFMNELYSEMALHEYQVVRLDLDDRRAWKLVIVSDIEAIEGRAMVMKKQNMESGIVVKLGRFETEKRLQRFVRILPVLTAANDSAVSEFINHDANTDADSERLGSNKIVVIDMRYPNGFAVQLSSQQENEA